MREGYFRELYLQRDVLQRLLKLRDLGLIPEHLDPLNGWQPLVTGPGQWDKRPAALPDGARFDLTPGYRVVDPGSCGGPCGIEL